MVTVVTGGVVGTAGAAVGVGVAAGAQAVRANAAISKALIRVNRVFFILLYSLKGLKG
jgi:hypothetical protein